MKNKISSLIGHMANDIINIINGRFDPYDNYFSKIQKVEDLLLEADENILITIISGAYGHVFEGLFSRKVMLNGKNVYTFCCDGYLKYCETIHEKSKFKWLKCAICKAQQEDYVRAFGGRTIKYSSLITAEDEINATEYIRKYFDNPINDRKFNGVDIERILYSALQRYYLMADPAIRNDKVNRGFLYTILITLIAMNKIINHINPKYVLSSHGTYSTWGSVVEFCKVNSLNVVTWGQNYNHCGIEFTYNDSYLTGVLNDTQNLWMGKKLSEKEYSIVKRFLDERLGYVKIENVAFDYNKNNKNHYSKDQLFKELNISPGKKLVGLFPNIPWDGQVTGPSNVFPQFRDWLKTTIDFFSNRTDVVLVIRSHPAELLKGDAAGYETTQTMLAEMYNELPNNIVLLGPSHQVNSYTLGENSDFCITYSSTITLELTYLGVPVILCGNPPFYDKNIAFDISSKESYLIQLNRGLRGELVVDSVRIDRLFKYLHYFFFMRTMPQTLVEVHDTIPKKYLFQTESELNADIVFDTMYKYIDKKLEMDFSRFYK